MKQRIVYDFAEFSIGGNWSTRYFIQGPMNLTVVSWEFEGISDTRCNMINANKQHLDLAKTYGHTPPPPLFLLLLTFPFSFSNKKGISEL